MFVRYAVEIVLYGAVFVPVFMAIGSGIKIKLRLLHHKFERGLNIGIINGSDL
jgi:hypothetical protein